MECLLNLAVLIFSNTYLNPFLPQPLMPKQLLFSDSESPCQFSTKDLHSILTTPPSIQSTLHSLPSFTPTTESTTPGSLSYSLLHSSSLVLQLCFEGHSFCCPRFDDQSTLGSHTFSTSTQCFYEWFVAIHSRLPSNLDDTRQNLPIIIHLSQILFPFRPIMQPRRVQYLFSLLPFSSDWHHFQLSAFSTALFLITFYDLMADYLFFMQAALTLLFFSQLIWLAKSQEFPNLMQTISPLPKIYQYIYQIFFKLLFRFIWAGWLDQLMG